MSEVSCQLGFHATHWRNIRNQGVAAAPLWGGIFVGAAHQKSAPSSVRSGIVHAMANTNIQIYTQIVLAVEGSSYGAESRNV
jgi:hypothetical protein